jgi:hypothetical protein
MELTPTFKKIIQSIIPINKTLQHDNMFICKSCKQLINKNKIEYVILTCQHIYNENTIPSIMILNKLEEYLVAPRMTFAQIYQLNGWGQYGIRGSIVNVLANVDKMQIILPRPTTCGLHQENNQI